MITKTSLQAIKALVELAKLPPGKRAGIARIARKIRAPQNYLAKVFQDSALNGLVTSQKGLNGGFRLVKAPAKIRLYDVVNALEDFSRWEGCFMGKGKCSPAGACAVHHRWGAVRRTYVDFLKGTTIADLMEN